MKRILLWEQESIVALDIKYLAEKADYFVRIVDKTDNPELLTIVENPSVFIISLDVDIGVLEKVKTIARKYGIPSLMLSSQSLTNPDTTTKNDLPVLRYLVKPFAPDEMIENINDLCRKENKKQQAMF